MPVAQFHLVEGRHSDEQIKALLLEATHAYVETLYPDANPKPLGRVRVFATFRPPQHWATAGALISEGGVDAPYFECLSLKGRPLPQLQALMQRFTDLIAKHLQCDPASVRGMVTEITPDLWCIGGKPASAVRGDISQWNKAD